MIAAGAKVFPGIAGAIAATVLYGLSFWRIVRKNRGNKVVECGIMAIMVTLAMAFLLKYVDLPDWVFFSFILLLFLLCMATLFFVAQRAYRALRNRKAVQ